MNIGVGDIAIFRDMFGNTFKAIVLDKETETDFCFVETNYGRAWMLPLKRISHQFEIGQAVEVIHPLLEMHHKKEAYIVNIRQSVSIANGKPDMDSVKTEYGVYVLGYPATLYLSEEEIK